MAIDVGSIIVYGALRAGSPTCRLGSHITLTFHPVAGIDPFNMVGGLRGIRSPGSGCKVSL